MALLSRLWPLVWLACAACLGPGRRGVDVPVVVTPDDVGPYDVSGGTLTLSRAVISLADLMLYDDQGQVMGEWAGVRRADLLGSPGPHGMVTIYDGHVVLASFGISGTPGLELSGVWVDASAISHPMIISLDADAQVRELEVDLQVRASSPPASLLWRLSLARVLSDVDWPALVDDAEKLGPAVLGGVSSPEVWRVETGG